MPDLAVLSAIISAIAAVTSVIIQHRRTPRLPKPPQTPVCTTILSADMSTSINDLPTYYPSMHRIDILRNHRR